MTEQQWLAETDIKEMFDFSKPTDRQKRLFAVACCKRILHLMTDPRSLTAVEVAERFADGKATKKELQESYAAALAALAADAAALAADAAAHAAAHAADAAAHAAARAAYAAALAAAYAAALAGQNWNESFDQERQHQANLLREIVNPFFQLAAKFNPEIKNLAEHVYQTQQDHQILADYLEEHYDEPELLNHLRQPIRQKGCWAVDLIRV